MILQTSQANLNVLLKRISLLDAENGAFWSGNCLGFLEPANHLSKYLVGGTERRIRREENVPEFDGLPYI